MNSTMNLRTPLGRAGAGLAAIAEAGRDDSGRAASGRARPPTSACGSGIRGLAGPGRLGRHPHGDDVVVDLVVGRDLDELDRALAPVAQRLDPERGAAVVIDAVEIVVEVPVALEQAEALRALVGEGRGDDPRRVVERAPDALAGARSTWRGRPNRGFPGASRRRSVFAFSEYQYIEVRGAMPRRLTSWRRKSALSMSMTTAAARLHDEAVGAGHARAVEQGIDRDRVRAWLGASRNRRG